MCLPADRNEQSLNHTRVPLANVFSATALRPLPPPVRTVRPHLRPPLPRHRSTERLTLASTAVRPSPAAGNLSFVHEINLVVDNYLRTVTVIDSITPPRNRHNPYACPVGEIIITMSRDDSSPNRPVSGSGAATFVRLFVALAVVFAATKMLANATAVVAAVPGQETRVRVKRQLPPIEQGNQVIDDIFQIPISTLNAVGSLIKSTRPLVRRTRERIQQLYTGQGQQQVSAASQYQQQRPQYAYNRRPKPSTQLSYFAGYNNNRRRPSREYDDNSLPQGRHNDNYY